ncbi:uncharacterized protein ACDP82_014981 [Pangshura tecta]
MNFSVLSILQAGPSNTSEFSCGYEVNMSGRWIPSPRSQAVNVTVTAWSLPIPLVAGCGGAATALALLLLLLLLIPLCRKKAATRRLSMSADISGVNTCGIAAETQPLYANIPFRASTALQEWSHDGQLQMVTHNQPAQPNNPGGKPEVDQNPQEGVKREEDTDARASNIVYSMLTPPSTMAQKRGGNYISEDVVYSEISY